MSVVAPEGFAAAGGHVGIKAAGVAGLRRRRLHDRGARVGGRGLHDQPALPPHPSRSRGRTSPRRAGRARAVVVTSGNANAATGASGLGRAPRRCATAVAGALGARDRRGARRPDRAHRGAVRLRRRARPAVRALCALGGHDRARRRRRGRDAILTTDSRPKTFVATHGGFRVGAMAKGAAMLAPNLATMLAVLTTDAAVRARRCSRAPPRRGRRRRSTASTSTARRRPTTPWSSLASGLAGPVSPELARRRAHRGVRVARAPDGRRRRRRDAGPRRSRCAGAASDHQAHAAARAVAGSLLVKCSLNGADPYWGRVVAELGRRGRRLRARPRDRALRRRSPSASGGEGVDHDAAAVAAHLAGRHVELALRPRARRRRGVGALLRPRAGLPRREPDDVVTADARHASRRRRGDPGRGAAVHPAVPRGGRRRQVRRGGARGRRRRRRGALASFAEDVALLRSVGLAPVVVHGGGPQIAELLATARALERVRRRAPRDRRRDPRHRPDGARRQGQQRARRGHQRATGRSRSGSRASTRTCLRVELRDEELGFVGDVDAVDPTLLHGLLAQGLVPVVATMGSDTLGQAYNVNADAVAGALAAALRAAKLVVLTDVDGIRRDPADPATRVARLGGRRARGAWSPSGAATGGMAPEGHGLRRRAARRRRRGAPPRRPRRPRRPARAVHGPRRRDDGDARRRASTRGGHVTKTQRQHRIAQLLAEVPVTSQAHLVGAPARRRDHRHPGDGLEGPRRARRGQGALARTGAARSRCRARSAAAPAAPEHLRRVLSEWVVDVASAGPMVVVKTPPGCAHVVASALDRGVLPATLGTVAGDDTIFVVVDERVGGAAVAAQLREVAGLEPAARTPPARAAPRRDEARSMRWHDAWCSPTAGGSTPPSRCAGCKRSGTSRSTAWPSTSARRADTGPVGQRGARRPRARRGGGGLHGRRRARRDGRGVLRARAPRQRPLRGQVPARLGAVATRHRAAPRRRGRAASAPTPSRTAAPARATTRSASRSACARSPRTSRSSPRAACGG